MWNKDNILNLINTRDEAVYRGLVAIYNRQTADEQSAEDTKHHNKMGFNGRDARFGSSLAKQVINWQNAANRTYRFPLSRTQLDKARNLLQKYAGQLAKVANEKANAECKAEVEAEVKYEQFLENQAELAYLQSGYRDF